jgi:penicillin-binding protein 2
MENVQTITSWIEENPKVDEIENRLLRLGVKSKESANLAGEIKYSYFNFAKWTTGDELNIAIGQGENAFTPLQLARYAATIGNGGKMNELGMIKAVEGEGITRRKTSVQAKVKSKNLKDVITGMRRVVTGGTLSNLTTLRVTTAGKTGTAQRSGRINPPDEVKYIKDHLSGINPALTWSKVQKEMNRLMKDFPEIYDNPNVAVRKAVMNLSGRKFDSKRIDAFKGEYDDFAWIMAVAPAEKPEIAVVCLIVQGGASRNAIPVVKELIGQYFDLKEEDREENRTIDYNQFFKNDKSKGRVKLEYLKKGTPDLGTESAIQPGDEGAAIQAGAIEDTDGTAMRDAEETTGETETARKDAID